ncbi:hypothetical protein JQC92_02375 [Shewanella sp. 202IG2-18]|uniref:hypothetical protein n=1 Tax=Parashewanella hymeniacidonis TaxID=2807618 RepID=UPI001961B4A3|nr:hypothetical protein [Parashewanella hymeniacidonis]MBM7070887.1 hypothetical protein [Parashewanella hymeniacidonis]
MSFLSKIGDFFSGGLGSAIVDGVKDYFPPSMSEQEKANLSLAIQTQADKKALEGQKLTNEAQKEFNRRIEVLEGSAADLKSLPIVGSLIIFLRGCQRPVWGFATLYMDLCWFSGEYTGLTAQQESALWVINILVLIFLFGERAFKNAAPIIERLIKAKLGIGNK